MKKHYIILNCNTHEYVAKHGINSVTTDIDKAEKWSSEENAANWLDYIWQPNMSGVYFMIMPIWVKH